MGGFSFGRQLSRKARPEGRARMRAWEGPA